ncbi:MAG: MotA/TolQ/ExbB proton channel family protein [Planctomycetes bacterium]|nr:MotA/TolQ/ExbB proton channel family protein [Planctomycetota bacterium]
MKTSRQQLACLAMLAGASFFWLVSPASGESGAVAGALQVNQPGLPAGEATIPTKNLLEVVRDGGPLMIVLGVCSFILFVFVFERAISLRRGRIIPRPFVKRFLEQLREGDIDRAKAIELCQQNRTPTAQVFEAAVQKWARPSVEVEQAIIDSGERVTYGLRRNLRLINGVATVAPLLGLLGTVLGMIRAFNVLAIADAMGRPELLATGISQALLTTAAGMSIAIPALIAYMFFISRVDRLIIEIDALGQKVVSLISADTWQNETPPAKSKSNRREKAA